MLAFAAAPDGECQRSRKLGQISENAGHGLKQNMSYMYKSRNLQDVVWHVCDWTSIFIFNL